MHHGLRKAYSVTSTDELVNALQNDFKRRSELPTHPKSSSIVFVFAGQGTQYPGMAKGLFETCRTFRNRILELDAISVSLGFLSFLDIINSSAKEMTSLSPMQTQVGLISIEIGLADLWKSWGIIPNIVVGHSLGEYAALCTAGALSVYDTIFLVGTRARLMENHCTPYTHGMLSVEDNLHSIGNILQEAAFNACNIACINGPSATVVSGPVPDLIALKDRFGPTRSTMLQVPYSFHSSQVDSILTHFHQLAASVQFYEPVIPVISTLLGEKVETKGVFGPDYLVRQSREPVRFLQAIEACREYGIDESSSLWLGIGPSPIFLGMIRSIQSIPSEKTLPTLQRKQSCWDSITYALTQLYTAGVDVRWSEYHREHATGLQLLDLPKYAFDLQNYWIPYEGDWALMAFASRKTLSNNSKFSTTCLHRIEDEVYRDGYYTVSFAANLTNPALLATIDGHRVSGLGLCPSSVYTDMALTAASYLGHKIHGSPSSPDMSVMNLEISHALVVPKGCDTYRLDVQCKSLHGEPGFEVFFESEDHRHGIQRHARCTVHFEQSAKWKHEWNRTRRLIKTRLDHLKDTSRKGSTHRILRDMVYKLFSKVVTYGERYRSLQEVFLDSNEHEAAAIFRFAAVGPAERFTISPYWIDGIIHLGGFALNAHPNSREDHVYISTGWKDLCISAPLSTETTYASYVHMQHAGHGLYTGDVYLLDGDEIVALCAGLRFQEMKATSLNALLEMQAEAALPQSNSERHTLSLSGDVHDGVSAVPNNQQSIKQWSRSSASNGSILPVIQSIVAKEVDMKPSDIPQHARFEELGIDSILRMPIVSKIQEVAGTPFASSIFDDYPTLSALCEYIQDMARLSPSGDSSPSLPIKPPSSSTSWVQDEDTPDHTALDSGQGLLTSNAMLTPVSQSTSETANMGKLLHSRTILLSGKHRPDDFALFLMPDGAGSPSSYTQLPALPHETPVYGLESPLCHEPLEWNCSFEAMATMYIEAIRKIQPRGPYMLGGWSLGGLHAYEVARQFALVGENVQGLLLIDTPSPNFLGHIADPITELLQDTGLLAAARRVVKGEKALERVINHMCKCVESLSDYVAIPMKPGDRPEHVVAIWAAHGAFDAFENEQETGEESDCRIQTARPEVRQLQRWMKERRTSFGPNGWDEMVGDIECRVAEGGHLSILHRPLVSSDLTSSDYWISMADMRQVEKTGTLVVEAVNRFMNREGLM